MVHEPRAGRSAGLARGVTEVLAPANVAASSLLLVGGLRWGALAVLFVVALPYGVVLAGVRARRWTDHHLTVRSQRVVPLGLGVASATAGLALLVGLDAPRAIVALVVASVVALVVTFVVTLRWKVSVHAGVVGGTVVVVALVVGTPTLAVTVPLALLVGWSRIVLRAHTPAQVLVGALIGAVVTGTVFAGGR